MNGVFGQPQQQHYAATEYLDPRPGLHCRSRSPLRVMNSDISKDVIRVIIIGAGQRGQAYAHHLQQDQSTSVAIVALADPNAYRASTFARKYQVPESAVFTHYEQIIKLGKCAFRADAVLICTQDAMHLDCVIQFSSLGYHILCEKPMATSLEDCRRMRDALKHSPYGPRIFGMGHVLRYSPHNMKLKQLLDDRVIGDVVSMTHTEPVGHSHFAHSYVRGNWRREDESSFSLLTKSCHDLDIIQWFLASSYPEPDQGRCKPSSICSIGSLNHFKKTRKPQDAYDAIKCMDCQMVDSCAYSAKKIYIDDFLENGKLRGFRKTLSDIEDLQHIKQALADTRYGTCVYELDNDVCDHQIVSMQYQAPHGAISVTFVMIAFSKEQCVRKTTIYGTRGQLDANGHNRISVFNFTDGTQTEHCIDEDDGEAETSSHGGGDAGLVRQFIKALVAVKHGSDTSDAQKVHIGCTIDDIFNSHEIVFKAEEARLMGNMLKI